MFIVLLYSVFVEPNWLETRRFDYKSEQIPNNFVGKKIVFVSDLHVSWFFKEKKLSRLVEKINGQNADVVIFGGDYVDSNPKYLGLCFEELAKINAKYGKFAVMGNHDYRRKVRRSFDKGLFEKAGITLLDNDSRWIAIGDQKIKIGGVTDYTFFDNQDTTKTTGDTTLTDFVILATHEPDFLETMDDRKVDVAFSGHTHGGQLSFFGLWAPIKPTDYGMKYLGKTIRQNGYTAYISKGVGSATLPLRFFARPDIIIVELNK